jgi:hypothetical protein
MERERHPASLLPLPSRVSLPLNPGHMLRQAPAGGTSLSRIVLAAVCLILGSALLIPVGFWLWTSVAAQEVRYLPDAHTEFVLLLAGRAIDSATVLVAATVVGATLLVTGLKLVR